MIKVFNQENSIISTYIRELREINIQKDSLRFRCNLERIGSIIGYELSKKLNYQVSKVETPLGIAEEKVLSDKLVLATILRAGLPLHQGLLSIFDRAENAYLSARRKYTSDTNFTIEVEYFASPQIENKILILSDPMIASGKSLVEVYKGIVSKGEPKELHVVGVIAAQEGIDYVQNHLPENTKYWIGAIDSELNEHSYIVPGLGDAGDLAFGIKE